MAEQLVRLSRYVCFVPYEDYMEVHHGARNSCQRIGHQEYRQLLDYTGFRPLKPQHQEWLENGTLVRPGMDHREGHCAPIDSEAALSHAYQQWYWRHEIESQREYRWLGQVAVKMPMDLFFYQELIYREKSRRLLELGYGKGGGLYFFHSILRFLNADGLLVGIDCERSPTVDTVGEPVPVLIHGDVRDPQTITNVKQLNAEYDLIVIDLGGTPHLNLQVLGIWSEMVAPGGVIVIEDLWSGQDEAQVTQVLDAFLQENPQFGLYQAASRYPFLKGAALARSQA